MAQTRSQSHSSPARNVFGTRISAVRQEKGWSQEQLAVNLQLAGWSVSRDVIARIETGRRTLLDSELLLIAKVLGLGLDRLAAELMAQVPAELAQSIHGRDKRWGD